MALSWPDAISRKGNGVEQSLSEIRGRGGPWLFLGGVPPRMVGIGREAYG